MGLRRVADGGRVSLRVGLKLRGDVGPDRGGDRGLEPPPLTATRGLYTRTARSFAVWRFSLRGLVSFVVDSIADVGVSGGLFKLEVGRDNLGLLREVLDGGTARDMIVKGGRDLPYVSRSASAIVSIQHKVWTRVGVVAITLSVLLVVSLVALHELGSPAALSFLHPPGRWKRAVLLESSGYRPVECAGYSLDGTIKICSN